MARPLAGSGSGAQESPGVTPEQAALERENSQGPLTSLSQSGLEIDSLCCSPMKTLGKLRREPKLKPHCCALPSGVPAPHRAGILPMCCFPALPVPGTGRDRRQWTSCCPLVLSPLPMLPGSEPLDLHPTASGPRWGGDAEVSARDRSAAQGQRQGWNSS